MIEGFPIEPKAVYDDAALSVALGVSAESLARRSPSWRITAHPQRTPHFLSWPMDSGLAATRREGGERCAVASTPSRPFC